MFDEDLDELRPLQDGSEVETVVVETQSTQAGQSRDVPEDRKARGRTRLLKLHKDFRDGHAKRRELEIDELRRPVGDHSTEFGSFLGDLVRKRCGLRYNCWREVKKEKKDYLWEKVKVYS